MQAGHIDKVEQHYHHASDGSQSMRWRFGTVPPRAGAFQDRDAATELASAAADGTAVLTGVGSRILSGLGGVGKTQLAADHAHTLWSDAQLDVLMWVTAASRDAIVSAYARAFAVMGGVVESNAEEAAGRWLEWLASTGKRWLVVLDDLQDPADLHGLWPPHTPTGRVVVTTRRRDASLGGHGRHTVEVGLFTPAESIAFLTQRLTRRPAQAVGATELARELGYLPVALAQAAAYVADRTQLTCSSYLERWADRRRTLTALLPRTGELPEEHSETVATTWSLSIDLADSLHPVGLARPLLEMASLLDPNGIPDAVVTAPATLVHLTRVLGRAVDAETAVDALSCLHRLSLISHAPDAPRRAIRVHALVQRATRETLDASTLTATARTAADALIQVWPVIERDTDLAAVLRGNTDALYACADTVLWQPDIHAVLLRAGSSLSNAGQLLAAIDHFHRMSATAEQLLGPSHPDTLTTRHNLARLRGEAGDVAGTAAAFEQLVVDFERVRGRDHPDTLAARLHVARWRGVALDVTGAAAAFELVVADYERVLGRDHPDTLAARHNLVYWRGEADDMTGTATELDRHLARQLGLTADMAIPIFEQLLADFERVLGADHPDTLAVRHNLARWRGKAGAMTGAAAAFEQLLADRTRVLGADHPDTLTTRHNLAHWRGVVGDVAGAVAAFEQLLADRTRVLGADHLDTLFTEQRLALWRDSANPFGYWAGLGY